MDFARDLLHEFSALTEEDILEMQEMMDALNDDDAWMAANEDVWRDNVLFDSFEADELPW